MTKQTKIIATEARFPLAKLSLSPMNPRQDVPEADVIELAESLYGAGMIQSIAGLAGKKDTAEIVAGGRRLRALKYLDAKHSDLAKTHPELANPMVMLAPDAETAEAWANMENVARRDLHPAEEIRAYGKMEAKGGTVGAIARAFAVNEKHIYRRLALAHLPDPVLDALAANEISLSNAAAFTVSTDMKVTLDVLERARDGSYSDHQIKQALKPDSVRSSDRRVTYVTEAGYDEAGGRKTADLFQDQTFFDDVALLDDLFEAKLTEAIETVQAEGWKWVEAIHDHYLCHYSMGLEKFGRVYAEEGQLSEEEAERYDALAELANSDVLDAEGEAELAALQAIIDGEYSDEQRAQAGLYVYVDGNGVQQVSGALVKPDDKKAAIKAGVLAKSMHGSSGSNGPKSPISQKLRDDLNRVTKGAHQHAALRDPDLLIDLLAYQLSHHLYWNDPFGITTTEVPNWPSTETEGYALDERLTTNPPRNMMDAKDIGASFRAFRKKGAEHVRGELVRFLAAQFKGGDEKLQALVAKTTKPNTREVWTPTAANFFSRVGGPYMVEIWRDLLELAEDHPTVTTFAKLKKGEKAAKLEALFTQSDLRSALGVPEAQVARIDAWLPEGME
ncbi:Nucleoid occlusion protein (plasmid) [Roseobacter fucihabitans]|uniref:Nucleoid occlusion protein n=1 Tax=Roseobacter fucihabitans TaxID=1537242 RepID=A0ABZ2BZI1_9RHOB|nr:ParB/RepB/Spo0J family partition protein [Roseobacter litoralis]MBC6965937.1 Chromosome-partitioning protein Spo0J [Roseobacter litoralis]